jgi:DNA-binding LacI/PurR family transcriptional regulator
MGANIKDVARLAGVSPSTVSRVIAGNSRISQQTARRVREVMDELGYYPNQMAQGLVSRTSTTLGIVLPRPADELFLNSFFPELIRGITTRASRSGYDVLLTSGASEQEELAAMRRLTRGGRVDGIVLLRSRDSDPVIDLLQGSGFPHVLIGRSEAHPDTLSVDTDNVQAGYDVTRHLVTQGHRRIGFVSGPHSLSVSRDRLTGYRKAMEESGLSIRPDWIVEGEFLQESGYRAMSFIASIPDRPTALIVIDDIVALGVMRGLTELGYTVPGDFSLASFNNTGFSELVTPPITSVDIGIYQLGYTAAHLLIYTLQEERLPQRRLIIPHRLMVRESSARINDAIERR